MLIGDVVGTLETAVAGKAVLIVSGFGFVEGCEVVGCLGPIFVDFTLPLYHFFAIKKVTFVHTFDKGLYFVAVLCRHINVAA